MKIFSHSSRFGNSIILLLLIISISGVFFSMYSPLTNAGAKIPELAILFIMLSVLFSLILFQFLHTSSHQALRNAQLLDQLKKSIQESKKNIIEPEEQKAEIAEMDYHAEANALMPKEENADIPLFVENVLSKIAKKIDIVQGVAYIKDSVTGFYSFAAGYAFFSESAPPTFIDGETLPGQVAKNKTILNLSEMPENYITILSGLGKGSPKHLLIIPILDSANICLGIIEMASFKAFDQQHEKLLEHLSQRIGEHIQTIGNSTKE